MKLKAKANEGWEDGKLITILQIEGDPLNLEGSGAFDLDIVVQITNDQIQKSLEPDTRTDAERKHAHAAKHNIKWALLTCMKDLAPCLGPDCVTWLGLTYVDCPHVKSSIPKQKGAI